MGSGDGSSADGAGDLGGLFGGGEFFHESEAEIERGAGAARGDQVAVDDDAFVGEDGGELVGHGEVRGVAFAFEQAGVVQRGRCGANRGEPSPGGGLIFCERVDARIGTEMFHAGAAGEKNEIENAIGGNRGQRGVGVQSQAVAAGDAHGIAEGGEGDFDAGATKQIDGRDGFDLFKTLWQNREYCRHGG